MDNSFSETVADEIIKPRFGLLYSNMTVAFRDFKKLVVHWFSLGLICLDTKAAILNHSDPQESVREFLDFIMLRLKKNPNEIPVFLDSLKECDSFCDIAENIRSDWESRNATVPFSAVPSHSLPIADGPSFNWKIIVKRIASIITAGFVLSGIVGPYLLPDIHPLAATHIRCLKLQQTMPTSPVYRYIQGFHELPKGKDEVYTEPLYTSHGGYQFTIKVKKLLDYNTSQYGLYVLLMSGKNDDTLHFPVNCIARVLLLDKNLDEIVEQLIQFDDSLPEEGRLRITDNSVAMKLAYGIQNFVPSNLLKNSNMVESVCLKIHIDPYQIIVPGWYSVDPAIYTSPVTLPHIFTLVQYSHFKRLNIQWRSKPFYTSNKGYKLQLLVDANGRNGTHGKGTHLSLLLLLLKGEYDEQLSFPINVTITVRLLNWAQDIGHERSDILHYNAPLHCRNQVFDTDSASNGFGPPMFIPHSRLEDTNETGYLFIKNDSVCFEITNIKFNNVRLLS